MKGFIIHPTYKVENGKAFIHLFGRLENGESFLTINEYKPYFFIRKADLEKALKIEQFDYEATHLKNFDDEIVAKVVLSIPADVAKLREKFSDKKIKHYEADIRFAYRFMIDKLIQGAVDIDGNFEKGNREKGEFVDRVYNEPGLKPADYFPKNLKIISVDIETDKEGKEIYCVALYSPDFKKVIMRTKEKLKNAVSVESEQEILLKLKEIILEQDPDIILGWNFIDFDMLILEKKFRDYKLPFAIGRTNEPCRLRIYSSFFQDSKADCTGRMVLDGIQVLKNNFVGLEDYKLNTAAKTFLNDKKIFEGEDRWELVEEAFKKNPQLLVDYNLKDAELACRVLEKTTALELSIQRSLLTGMPLDRVRASIASLDSLYLRELRNKGFVAPSAGFDEREERITGGYVMNPKPGIYDYVIVCDFKSLYPSIMRTFNIDPWSFVPGCKGKNLIKSPNGACFKNQDGILPAIIQHLWEQRETARKKKNELARHAIKILMNSFFGVLANPTCRFYSRDMANAITTFGQQLIKLTAKKVEEMDYEVIYSDTDSIFVDLKVESYKEAEKIGKEISEHINNFFEKYAKEEYGRKNYLELEFEKVYKRFLMPRVRHLEIGSKKRYAGLVIEADGKEKIDIVGLEFVRRDWTDIAKNFQMELFDKIFHKKEVAEYIKQLVQEVREGKHDKLLIYRKAIRKEVEEYTKTTPPHVKAARLLGSELKSNIIEYVMTTEGPEPIQKQKHRIDYEHYIEKQIKPIADAILVFYNQNFDDIIKGSSQKTLFGY
ncbi:MAG TPA: DNA polymerase II [Candidatus Nanoarchaeia archaeon]|nr:DNA polymerase II [Candidatus Nanoarchaeia archaeon]